MTIDRRAARTAWKDRDTEWTVYVARTGGQAWVGVSTNVAAIQNRLGFTLRLGDCRTKGMQAAYDGTLTIEELEILDPALGPLARQDAIKDRRAHWCAELDATPIEA
ncbi:GIY-YIG nuclease family protein [Pseudooceanicola onchidii]|uniref:GIY-YIG nuclease family protein n=1 Tax=Pseudooceanicola onchidii TaxID=2562279 RepID=UPI0010AAD5CF|nr:GIY-YIG nuclease family protein [Pseudooceanicola onchidii]